MACDEFAGTCFSADPDSEVGGEAGCELHLVNRHLEMWAECRIGFSPMAAPYVAAEDAPELSPEVYLEVEVIIQRVGPTGTDEAWGVRLQEGVPGVIIDGAALYRGTLPASETSTSFTFNLSADLSAGVDEAVMGVAFWDSEHKPQVDYLAFTIEDGVPPIPLAWWALIAAIIALIVATIALIVAMRRRVT